MNLRESIRRILKESVPPQVRRRQEEFDRIFLHYKKEFSNNTYRNFNIYWNILMETSMATLYHVWFVNTVPDDDWEESEKYIQDYLTKKYKEETKQMWEKKHHKRLNESEDDKEKKIQKNLKAIRQLLDTIDFDGLCEMWVEYNPEDGDYEIRSKRTRKNLDTEYMVAELRYIEDTIRSWGLRTYVFAPWYVENCEDEVEFLNESEMNTDSTLYGLLNVLFDGFENIDYDWANYMCGMGECCDPYAIGFTLPNKDYDDYIFKLVDGEMYDDDGDYPKEFQDELPEPCFQLPDLNNPRFDTIVFYGLYAEEIEDYMGHESNWKSDLLEIINNQFGFKAERIIVI